MSQARITGDQDNAAPDGLITVHQATKQLMVSRATLGGWIQEGLLPAQRIGRRRYVRIVDLAAAQAIVHLGTVVPIWRADPQRTGQRLRSLREAAGRTQLSLAAAAGVTHEAISNLERGKRTPYAETVRQLAHALGVSPERFVDKDPVGLTMLTVAEAAYRLDVPAGRLQKWVRHGELPGVKVSGQWRVPEIAVAALGRSGRMRGQSHRLDPRYRG